MQSIGGDPSDSVWTWFVCRGPHGPSFTWNASRTEPRGFVGVDLLRKVVDEQTAEDARFPVRAREVARLALKSTDQEFIRRGLQVLAVLGDDADAEFVGQYTSDAKRAIANDAKAALFELKRVTLRKGR